MWRGSMFNWGCQAGGGIVGYPEISSLHVFNSLKNKLCRLQFFFWWVLVAMWTCGDFCLAFFPSSLRVTSKLESDQRQLKKNKFPNVPAPCIHTSSFCLSQHHTHFLSENKSMRHRLMFFFSPRAHFCQTLQHFNWFLFLLVCVCLCVFYFST